MYHVTQNKILGCAAAVVEQEALIYSNILQQDNLMCTGGESSITIPFCSLWGGGVQCARGPPTVLFPSCLISIQWDCQLETDVVEGVKKKEQGGGAESVWSKEGQVTE